MLPPDRCRPLILLAVAIAVIGAAPRDVQAAVTQTQLDTNGFLTNSWASFIASLDTAINAILSGGSYIQWARNLMLGAFVITFIAALGQYAMAASGVVDLAAILVRGAIVTALFTTYSAWSGVCFQGSFELGLQIQLQALGSSDIMAPALFIAKVFSSFQVQNGSIWNFNVETIALDFLFTATFIIVAIASFFAAAWPVLVYGVAKLAGPFLFPFLFHERTSSFFDGWLRFYAGALGFMVLGRLCLIIVSILFSSVFSIPFSANPNLSPVVLQPADLGGMTVLFAVGGLSILLLFATGAFVAAVVGGSNISMSKPLARASQTAAALMRAAK